MPPEKRFDVADAAPGISGESETSTLGLVSLAHAVDIASSLVVTMLVVDFMCSARVTFFVGQARMQICRNPDSELSTNALFFYREPFYLDLP